MKYSLTISYGGNSFATVDLGSCPEASARAKAKRIVDALKRLPQDECVDLWTFTLWVEQTINKIVLIDASPPSEGMKYFYIVVERIPGDRRTEEYFDCHCNTDSEAWDYARSVARLCGPSSRVKSVEQKDLQ